MASRLIQAGHDLTVWNRTPEKANPLLDRGAKLGGSPAEVAVHSEVVITMLATPQALDQVVFGPRGLSEGLEGESVLIDMSTVGPEAIRATATWLRGGVKMLDAPVLGSVPQARSGSLKIFVGGSEEVFRTWLPVLEVMGKARWIGSLGSGACMKLVANSALMAVMTGLAEALSLGDALDLEERALLDVLSDSPIGATVRSKRANIQSGDYPANFKLTLAKKDIELVVEEAARLGLNLPVAMAAKSWLEAAERSGMGEMDYSAVIPQARRKGQAFKHR